MQVHSAGQVGDGVDGGAEGDPIILGCGFNRIDLFTTVSILLTWDPDISILVKIYWPLPPRAHNPPSRILVDYLTRLIPWPWGINN